ncbi:MAG: hypothetical protein VX257_04895, partial [Planctomycetota bacterium]|nr:hypothetical protein [Planctomycetota bacterium]
MHQDADFILQGFERRGRLFSFEVVARDSGDGTLAILNRIPAAQYTRVRPIADDLLAGAGIALLEWNERRLNDDFWLA